MVVKVRRCETNHEIQLPEEMIKLLGVNEGQEIVFLPLTSEMIALVRVDSPETLARFKNVDILHDASKELKQRLAKMGG